MKTITVSTVVNAPIEKVWDYWNSPDHIKQWAFASDDWHAPYAENDLRVGGSFKTTMAAKDGSFSFDFEGVYDNVLAPEKIAYTILDGRKVEVNFEETAAGTVVTEAFEAEGQNPEEMQRNGWQAFLENFKKHVESD